MHDSPLLEVDRLTIRFRRHAPPWSRGDRYFTAVNGVSFALDRARTLVVLGESGSGKSTLARAILGLVPIANGAVRILGTDVASARGMALRRIRRTAQMIFQDPAGSLNPRQRVGDAVAEPLMVHRLGTRTEQLRRAAELLERCGLPPDAARRYPHEFSGGQRQRIAIARALALSPALLVCDEPTSALDVSVQAQILNLLVDLQRELGLAYLLITHDLAVARHMADHVAVMRHGAVVESGTADSVLGSPHEAYTRTLVTAAG
ncbi:MAG: ABC transporter ATP-binding protein [Phycisphaerae bacterium]|nr:MAG: ABC transporter ATP-binding protein [Phycisphaerae bacterium]